MKQLVLVIILCSCLPAFGLMSPDLVNVVSRRAPGDLIPIDIVLKDQMNIQELKSAVAHLSRPQRRIMVAQILKDFSTQKQVDLLNYLRKMKQQGKVANIKSFWINNAVYCEATKEAIETLDKRKDIYYVDYDLKPIELEKPSYTTAPPDKTREITWGVSKIRADQIWQFGFTGQGVVVGLIDTGVNYNHLDLADHMWTDPNYPNHGWNFEYNNNNPMDEHGHGTHTAGTIASDGTAGTQCGVAPDAQIMALRVRTQQADSIAENQVWDAMQFVVSPPLSPGNGGDLISMSLGWQYQWNPRRATWRTNCNNVGAAGIVMIVAAGNERATNTPPNALRCPGDVPPPWQNPQNGATGAPSDVISIGATDSLDQIAYFSSPGPVTWQNISPFNDYQYPPGLTSPDVSAPGLNVKSCDYSSNNGYAYMSGTSMATPHTAGVVALMLSKKPDLDPLEIDSILETTALDLGLAGKDNDFGAGRIDALNAIIAVSIEAHNIAALDFLAPESKEEELTTIQPQVRFVNSGIYDETNIPVQCEIRLDGSLIYTSSRVIPSMVQGNITTVSFDNFSVGHCGSHYEAKAFCDLSQDTIFYDDTTGLNFVAGRVYEIVSLGCNAWKYPNADSGIVPSPTDPNWILATVTELQQLAVLDNQWWVTAGATDTAHQDLQLYGFYLGVPDTLIEQLTVEWWGHHGNPPHDRCALYFWNDNSNSWAWRTAQINVPEDMLFTSSVGLDSASFFVGSGDYLYVAAGADVYVKACCPLLFTYNGMKNVFIGDILTGGDIGTWIDHFLGINIYLPPDYDEFVKINGDDLVLDDGRYRLTINEMLQEVTYLDEVRLYAVDHPADYEVYPHEALLWPGYHDLSLHTSQRQPLQAAYDSHGKDILSTLAEADRVYVPFECSEITGYAKPFTIMLDVGDLIDPGAAVLYLYGSVRFPDAGEIGVVSDIYRARQDGMKVRRPKVEVLDEHGKWHEVWSCGVPAGHKKYVTYPLYDAQSRSIFKRDDHRLRITFYQEVYLDQAWVSCLRANDYQITELNLASADLHYYGYAAYYSEDGKYPGNFDYDHRVVRDYAQVAGYYTRYGEVESLITDRDSRFVIMAHGDEVSLEFLPDRLPALPAGWKRDFIFAVKGFYKMARPGRAYAYGVEPLPFYGMRADLSAGEAGYYPYDPSPGLIGSILGRLYAKIVWDYPFSWSDAWQIIKAHLTGRVNNKYPAKLVEYCQTWNTRGKGVYYPDHYADLPPHRNIEGVPLAAHDGHWPLHLAALGIPFGAHSLHSNYVRVWLVTTIPIGIEEQKIDIALITFDIGYPNPFRNSLTINYSLTHRTDVQLNIYDATGRLVRCLVDDMQEPGQYRLAWDGKNNHGQRLASGIYFVNFKTAEYQRTKKAILLK